MKIEKTTVLEYLKPKVKALGFKKDIVEGIAADIADNLNEVADDASEEDINAVIKPAVDAVIPSLKLAQRLTNQGIEEFRKKYEQKVNEPKEEPKEDPKEDTKETTKELSKPKEAPSNDTLKLKDDKETPEWGKTLIESIKQQAEFNKRQTQLIENLQAKLTGIMAKTTAEKRRTVLNELLEDAGAFGKRTIKNFERMSFDTDEDFDNFVSDVKEDLEQLNQERADANLAKFGVPKVETQQKTDAPKPQPLTDAELEELAASM